MPDETPVRVWLHPHGKESERLVPSVVSALRRHGIQTCQRGPDSLTCGGILLFSAFSDELCERVRDFSGDACRSVLAVALEAAALDGAKAWQLLNAGACDVFGWDAAPDTAGVVAARFERLAAVDRLMASPVVRDNLVGQSRAWISVLRRVVEVARFTDSAVLITGESGTGKELVARLIHTLDPRPDKRDLVVLDCTTVVPSLSGSEFFGHERGAFTSAVSAREGAFGLADGGTLFLDEIGELSTPLQAELLRVVQEKAFKPVGSNDWRVVNFRLVCATNRDLLRERVTGAFRRDFYYRIASWTCRLPSLSERREDILPLARHFLKTARQGGEAPELDPPVGHYLQNRNYPGNVRELRHLVNRIMNSHVGNGPITVGDIPEEERPQAARTMGGDWRTGDLKAAIRLALAGGATLREIGAGASEIAIEAALDDAAGSLQRAARRLGVTDRALQMRRATARGRAAGNGGPPDDAAPVAVAGAGAGADGHASANHAVE